jgi:post-segregation antitoxin (ccd killing protein)
MGYRVRERISGADIAVVNVSRGATKACQALIEAAATRWHEEEGAYRDDITAVVVCLQKLWPESQE